MGNLVRVDLARICDAVCALNVERIAQGSEFVCIRSKPQITGGHVPAVAARLVGKAREFLKRKLRQLDVDRVRKLYAEATGRAAGATLARAYAAFEDDDITNAARGEVIRDARADDSAADDNGVSD
jgi:hypothetical protein